MERFFENNLYIIFALILYSILLNNKPNDEHKRIIVIYTFMAMLTIFNILDIKIMLIIFMICAFIYFEILMDDYYKFKIIKKIHYKIIDYLYLLNFRYLFVFYALSLFFINASSSNFINIFNLLGYFIFINVIFFICNNEFELYTFTEIMQKLMDTVNFGNFQKISSKKLDMLLYIEDKSFLERPKNYTLLCWDYIRYRINKINEVLDLMKDKKVKGHKLTDIYNFIKYALTQFIKQLSDLPGFIKRIYRGHSTIEMQLFRSLAVKTGYTKKVQRKFSEIIYTPMFFVGLKDYYKLNFKTVTDIYYKNYIITCYLNFAKVFYNGKSYSNVYEFFNKRRLNDAEFLIYTLCLSGKLDKNIDSIYYYNDIFEVENSKIQKSIKKLIKKQNLSMYIK